MLNFWLYTSQNKIWCIIYFKFYNKNSHTKCISDINFKQFITVSKLLISQLIIQKRFCLILKSFKFLKETHLFLKIPYFWSENSFVSPLVYQEFLFHREVWRLNAQEIIWWTKQICFPLINQSLSLYILIN